MVLTSTLVLMTTKPTDVDADPMSVVLMIWGTMIYLVAPPLALALLWGPESSRSYFRRFNLVRQ